VLLLPTLLALSLHAAPPRPFVAGPSVEGISEYRLPNGFRVLFVPDPSKPSVTVNLTVFVGSRHENYGEKGMAHLFEHMLFKKTKRFADVKQELTRLGGMANGTTWFDRTNYFETFPADDAKVKLAIELEAERLRNAIISREQLATEMTVVRNEFEMGENEPESVLADRTMAAAHLWHNYGNSTIGAKSDIENVPNEKLLAFYEAHYQPDNAMLIIAGRFDETKALKVIADTFGKMPRPRRPLSAIATYTEEPTQDGEVSVTVRRVGGTPVLTIGYHAPAGSDPDSAAIDVLDALLGDSPSGRLYKDLVETKKAAKVGCESFTLKERGYFLCTVQLNEKTPVGPARDALIGALEGFAKRPPTQEEVDRARTAILKQYDLLLNASDRVGIFLSEFAAAGDWRLLFLSRDRIEAVTPDDVARVAAKYFKPSNRTLGEYVPTEKPDRAEVPRAPDLAPALQGYTGRAAVAQGEAFDATPANIEARTKRLDVGGLKVALLPKKTRGETVHLALQLRFGSETSLSGKRAASDFTARMLLRGTKTKTREQVKDLLDQLKAQVRVTPSPQGVTMNVEVRRLQLEATLALLAECLKSPALDAKEFEQLKREALAELEQRKDDPMAVGQVALQRALSPFPEKGHPLYVPTLPEVIAETAALKVDDLRAFHSRFYGAGAAFVSAVGDFDEPAVRRQLEALFAGWKAPEAYARIPVTYRPLEQTAATFETPDKKMAFFGAGLPFSLRQSDPDFAAMTLADYMLGGGFLNGRVPQRLREKEGLSYGAGTLLKAGGHDDFGVLMGYAIFAPENLGKVERGFTEELALAVDKGFTDAELALAREGLLKDRQQSRSEDDDLAVMLLQQLDLGRTMRFEQELDERLSKLSVREVNAALKKYVDPRRFSVVRAGDFKPVTPPK
jgi:zinc protease